MMFKHFDVDDKNYITTENISMTMSKMGKNITRSDLNTSMRLHQFQNENAISFDEFKIMFADNQALAQTKCIVGEIQEEDFMLDSRDGSPTKVNQIDISPEPKNIDDEVPIEFRD